MQRLLDFFRSVRLALTLLMILAVAAMAGTLRPLGSSCGEVGERPLPLLLASLTA